MAAPSPGAAAGGGESGRASFELADVVRMYGGVFLDSHPTSEAQRKVLRAIGRCRTAALGGHIEACGQCGQRTIAYNSCRNRHCPKCQGTERARWMEAEAALLLPVSYFHSVFTLPHALNPLIRVNHRKLYDLLFQAASATLKAFAADPKYLGAEPAITMVLHTWGQTLTEHVHVHCVVSGGGLSPDGSRFIRCKRSTFLFPVRAMSAMFRGKYLAGLERARARGELQFLGQSAPLAESDAWQALLAELRTESWVVYAKPPFGGPERVLKYLSRYTHRIAISNQRIVFVGEGRVRFRYRDYGEEGRVKEMSLAAEEFLRRFLLHVVPRGFMRIRHYGLTANGSCALKLGRCRELLGEASRPDVQVADTPADAEAASPDDRRRACCPICGGKMRVIEYLAPKWRDTS